MDPVRWSSPESGASEEARELLKAARPLRAMTAEQRARSSLRVARIARGGDAAGRGGWLRGLTLQTAVAVVLLVLLWVVRGSERVPVAMPVGEGGGRGEAMGFVAWSAEVEGPIESKAPEQEVAEVPGYGDICGRVVCERLPSCCEGAWDEQCDRMLVDLSRPPGAGTLTDMGRCYWHDREFCPQCACPIYLKRKMEPEKSYPNAGYDGHDHGTGCIRDEKQLLPLLKRLCVEGYCEE
jgi:hypothetical protein